jgi:hypothetical protein
MDTNVLYYAAKYNNIKTFTYAIKHNCLVEEERYGVFAGDITNMIAEHNNFRFLMYAHSVGCEIGDETMTYAAMYGNIEMLAYSYVHYKFENKVDNPQIAITAAGMGHFNCLKFVMSNKFEYNIYEILNELNRGRFNEIDLDDVWYRSLFFKKISPRLLNRFPNLKNMVDNKKEDIKERVKLLNETFDTIPNNIPTDIVNFIIEKFI